MDSQQTPPTADKRFVIDPETLILSDAETGERFEFVSESIAEHANLLEGDSRTLYVLLTIATYRICSAVEVSERGINQQKQYHDLSKEWLRLYGPDLANNPSSIRAALAVATELDELMTWVDVESILTFLRDTIADLQGKEVRGE